jgi:hypothetical protein
MACGSLVAARKRNAQKVSELPAHLTIIIPKAEECQDTPREPDLAERDFGVAGERGIALGADPVKQNG